MAKNSTSMTPPQGRASKTIASKHISPKTVGQTRDEKISKLNKARAARNRGIEDSTMMNEQKAKHKTDDAFTDVPQRGSPQGSTNRKILPDSTGVLREGHQFTVGNVGNNGMIYLRPSKRSVKQVSAISQQNPETTLIRSASGVDKQRTKALAHESIWTQASGPIASDKRTSAGGVPRIPTLSSLHLVSQSNLQSEPFDSTDANGFKIVIDRAQAEKNGEIDDSRGQHPPLEVPIPHYRLGTPCFSSRGTAFLHGSLYAPSSIYEDSIGSPPESEEYRDPPPSAAEEASYNLQSCRHSQPSPAPNTVGSSASRSAPIGPHNNSHGFYRPREPITPQLYDELSKRPDDPAVVRYSPTTGEIIAASPARIIAQITSENFLDYELLSDFFLTVRAYMSVQDLLSYLLARFEWAINKFDDSGRVIRVRAFAALRHWILNYFSYDFVLDRGLRVQFCDRLNSLARVVKARATYGASDMKLIADLKKCWNGRCMLYWDDPRMGREGSQELEIEPGGLVSERVSHLDHRADLGRPLAHGKIIGTNYGAKSHPELSSGNPDSGQSWQTVLASPSRNHGPKHDRQVSAVTTKSLPTSPMSDLSMPILSCSIPMPLGPRRFHRGTEATSKTTGTHPLPVPPERTLNYHVVPATPTQPAGPQTHGAHRRSGSFNDAVRDRREPLSSKSPGASPHYLGISLLYTGSLIRGNVVAPSVPQVGSFASLIPGLELPDLRLTTSQKDEARTLGSANNPAMKSLIGNIRRALSTKQNGHTYIQVAHMTRAMEQLATDPRREPLPSIGTNSRTQAPILASPNNFGNVMRIDVLAVQAVEAFKTTSFSPAELMHDQSSDRAHYPQMPSDIAYNQNNLLKPGKPKLGESALTSSSQSIMIVDDTGFNFHETVTSTQLEPLEPPFANLHTHSKIYKDPADNPVQTKTAAKASDQSEPKLNHTLMRVTSSAVKRGHSHQTNKSSSMSLRRYASYQSTFTKRASMTSFEATTVATKSNPDVAKGNPTTGPRMLRRRPGGDLRAYENVHDLEVTTRPHSAGSMTTYSDSLRDSALFLKSGVHQRTSANTNGRQRDENQAPSYLKTHSSQAEPRRPSFEAAVAKFASIPDPEEGGIEATLLKLEGRYTATTQNSSDSNKPADLVTQELPSIDQGIDRISMGVDHLHFPLPPNAGSRVTDHAVFEQSHAIHRPRTGHPLSYTESEVSINSQPLLERHLYSSSPDPAQETSRRSTPTPMTVEKVENAGREFERTPDVQSHPNISLLATEATSSFLLDEDEAFLSDTEDDEANSACGTKDIPEPLRIKDFAQVKPVIPTRASTRSSAQPSSRGKAKRKQYDPRPDILSSHRKISTHLPFICGFDSELLAQQFTIVEKDALHEIDWKDLVDMKWQKEATSTTNWVDYLSTEHSQGVDLVTARFNVTSKWCISEIVLTKEIDERVICITKYIHIAHHARRIHNYSTMLQLTLALTSTDCRRLEKTWERVPTTEKLILKELEDLVSPRRNFHNLRREMEQASTDTGIIPVVALYIHDLTYNAQKPAQIASTRNGEPLINFERYRNAALIVKSLLRLIDASSKYEYVPVEGVIEHCLWMTCLADSTITSMSNSLEIGMV